MIICGGFRLHTVAKRLNASQPEGSGDSGFSASPRGEKSENSVAGNGEIGEDCKSLSDVIRTEKSIRIPWPSP